LKIEPEGGDIMKLLLWFTQSRKKCEGPQGRWNASLFSSDWCSSIWR